MPRQRTDGYWISRVHALAESEPRPSAAQIELRLKKIGAQEGREDFSPSVRTIVRILKEHDNNLSDRERAFYREFYWPQAMELELLPWEATRLALDLLRTSRQRGLRRPTVRKVLWHYRLNLASPTMTFESREVWVSNLLALEARNQAVPERLDWLLAFEPWRSELHADFFNRAFPDHPWRPVEKED